MCIRYSYFSLCVAMNIQYFGKFLTIRYFRCHEKKNKHFEVFFVFLAFVNQ